MACFLKTKTLIDVSNQLRVSGKKIVLTHGSFDLFHIGHMELLKLSKKLGDYLIVGLESDERIQGYKNVIRPIIPLQQRIEILLENKSIDFVFALDGTLDLSKKYYLNLSEKINPNFITFGRNFSYINEMSEREKAMKNCQFKRITHKYNNMQSTTKIIEEIAKRYSVS